MTWRGPLHINHLRQRPGDSINVLVKNRRYPSGYSGILTSPFRDMMTTVPVTDVEELYYYIQNKYTVNYLAKPNDSLAF